MNKKLQNFVKVKKCYEHLGGKLGERLFNRLVELEWLKLNDNGEPCYEITEKGREELKKLGVNLEA